MKKPPKAASTELTPGDRHLDIGGMARLFQRRNSATLDMLYSLNLLPD